MFKLISVDPGKNKCGLIYADAEKMKVFEAIVIESNLISQYIKEFKEKKVSFKVLVGNGTTSKIIIKSINALNKNTIIVEEKNTTFRAKQRFFEIFPLKGYKRLLPREVFLLNKNLDAIAALIILEDYLGCKFSLDESIGIKTWLK